MNEVISKITTDLVRNKEQVIMDALRKAMKKDLTLDDIPELRKRVKRLQCPEGGELLYFDGELIAEFYPPSTALILDSLSAGRMYWTI